VPSRLFLNDGNGAYEEFNPSGFQLSSSTIASGNPGLWCEGIHVQDTFDTTGAQCDIADTPLGAEIGDIDGDFDIDIVQGARNEIPRVYQSRLEENGGTLGYRDVTHTALAQTATGGGNYEQELGDLDGDGDLDLYVLNWSGFDDTIQRNDGTGTFGTFTILPGSGADDNEGEWFDYDNDGDLDLFVANFSGQDKLYRNSGAPNHDLADVTNSQLPSYFLIGLQVDTCDVDLDGDYDVLVANDAGQPNTFLKNLTQTPDTHAPYVPHIEQAPDRAPSSTPTAIRAHVYDNAAWNVTQFNEARIEYRVNGGAPQLAPMVYAGGNLFRGEIPGNLTGLVSYRVQSSDLYGNLGVSAVRSYVSDGGGVSTFCVSKPSSIAGCVPSLYGPGTSLSKSGGSGSYDVVAAPVPGGGNPGILIFTVKGLLGSPANTPFGQLCLSQFLRASAFPAVPGGTSGSCSGVYKWNFGGAVAASPAVTAGSTLHAQGWYRDPANSGGANFTEAIGAITVTP